MKAIAVSVFLAAVAFSTAAQTKPAPPQYKAPAAEPVPESRTLENAPEAPELSADWSKVLVEHHEAITTDRVRIHVFRLRPGDDLLGSIRAYVKQNHIQAAGLLSWGGSLTRAASGLANPPEA